MAKWNEVLRIEEALGAKARFAGLDGMPARRKDARHTFLAMTATVQPDRIML
jgi:hypothetical protein